MCLLMCHTCAPTHLPNYLQEERLSLLMDDLREELLDRLDGLQLRLQVRAEGRGVEVGTHTACRG